MRAIFNTSNDKLSKVANQNFQINNMTLEKITLTFPSLNQLWEFVRETKMNYTEFSAADFSLICNCNQADVELAKAKYGATL